MGRSKNAEIEVTVKRQGDAAVLVVDSAGTEAWIPHSILDDDSEITADSVAEEEGVLVIPQWKADDAGLE